MLWSACFVPFVGIKKLPPQATVQRDSGHGFLMNSPSVIDKWMKYSDVHPILDIYVLKLLCTSYMDSFCSPDAGGCSWGTWKFITLGNCNNVLAFVFCFFSKALHLFVLTKKPVLYKRDTPVPKSHSSGQKSAVPRSLKLSEEQAAWVWVSGSSFLAYKI